jgi:hypothetical protein
MFSLPQIRGEIYPDKRRKYLPNYTGLYLTTMSALASAVLKAIGRRNQCGCHARGWPGANVAGRSARPIARSLPY